MTETTTIRIFKNDRIWLSRLKDKLGVKSLDLLINKIRKVITKFGLEKELEEIK